MLSAGLCSNLPQGLRADRTLECAAVPAGTPQARQPTQRQSSPAAWGPYLATAPIGLRGRAANSIDLQGARRLGIHWAPIGPPIRTQPALDNGVVESRNY